MTDTEVLQAIGMFLERQAAKLETIEGSRSWKNGYAAALGSVQHVIDALKNGQHGEPDAG